MLFKKYHVCVLNPGPEYQGQHPAPFLSTARPSLSKKQNTKNLRRDRMFSGNPPNMFSPPPQGKKFVPTASHRSRQAEFGKLRHKTKTTRSLWFISYPGNKENTPRKQGRRPLSTSPNSSQRECSSISFPWWQRSPLCIDKDSVKRSEFISWDVHLS